jgi:hypothetical protein
MVSSSARMKRTLQATVSEGELQQYLEVVADHDPTLDENNYVVPETPPPPHDRRRDSSQSGRGLGGARSQAVESEVVDTISQHFNKDQIGLLIKMLQDIRVDKRQSEEEVVRAWEVRSPPPAQLSPASGGETDSITLRGHLSQFPPPFLFSRIEWPMHYPDIF